MNRLSLHKLGARLPTKGPAVHGDGGGLSLKIGPAGSRSWSFRFSRQGRAYERGLGVYPTVSLAAARAAAANLRAELAEGKHPETHRKTTSPRSDGTTFEDAAAAYIKSFERSWSHLSWMQWTNSLTNHVMGSLGHLRIEDIDHEQIMAVMLANDLWHSKPETADRVLQRIGRILQREFDRAGIDRPSPAERARRLLPARSPRMVQHRPSIPWAEMPKFMARLRRQDGTASRALELLVLTICRPSEIYGATWDEISEAGDVFTIGAERYKTHKAHVVPLVPAALACLPERGEGQVFKNIHSTSMNHALAHLGYKGEDATVHGMRSSARDWMAEAGGVEHFLAEAILGHSLPAVTAAYLRTDRIKDKREALGRWADFLLG